ncbi:MAG: diguanylate cyclase domain-containing protein, partial [Sulfobacillus sp.]
DSVWQGRGSFMTVLQTGKLLLIQDIASDPALVLQHDEALKLGFRSFGGFPIVVQGHVFGVLNLYHSTPHFFQSDELQLMEKVVDAIAWSARTHDRNEHLKRAVTQERLVDKILESQEAMTITDANANILLVNDAFTKITGYGQAEVIGQNPRILQSDRQNREFYQRMWEALLTTGQWKGEIWNKRKNGEIYAEWLTISAVKDERGVATNYVAHFVDLSKWKVAVGEIERLVHYDPLTGLANRKRFFQVCNQMWSTEGLSRVDGFLLVINLDRLRVINDSLGHRVGDLLLQEVANRLSQETRNGDMVARLGGDEFVLLCHASARSETVVAEMEEFAESVHYTLTQPYVINQHVVHITPSIGAQVFARGYSNTQEVMQEANLAMDQAKSVGGNCVKYYEPKMKHQLRTMYELEQDLRIAIERGEIQLYYQGQVDHQGRLVGAEVLSRWTRKGMTVPPSVFIPIAEQTGLITDLG